MPDWPHAPVHRLDEAGAYMVTAGTYRKAHRFNTGAKLTIVRDRLFETTSELGWALQAWAVMANQAAAVQRTARVDQEQEKNDARRREGVAAAVGTAGAGV